MFLFNCEYDLQNILLSFFFKINMCTCLVYNLFILKQKTIFHSLLVNSSFFSMDHYFSFLNSNVNI